MEGKKRVRDPEVYMRRSNQKTKNKRKTKYVRDSIQRAIISTFSKTNKRHKAIDS